MRISREDLESAEDFIKFALTSADPIIQRKVTISLREKRACVKCGKRVGAANQWTPKGFYHPECYAIIRRGA